MCIQEVYGINHVCGHFREVGTKERDCMLPACALSSSHSRTFGHGPCRHPHCRKAYRVVLKSSLAVDLCVECSRRRSTSPDSLLSDGSSV